MPKMKTHKGAAKRFRVTGTGKVKRQSPANQHKFLAKSSKQKRRLDAPSLLSDPDRKRVKKLMPYHF
ncbi:MAG: 50S ribosomal protein L35 [Bacillota bacterium]|jgi:large subunit ribosomal protein L35